MSEPARHLQSVPGDIDNDGDRDLRDAIIETEMSIGRAEETPKKAWYHALLRIGRMIAGFALILAGLAMMVLPGPGVITIASGLVVLSRDVKWADRLLRNLRRRVPGLEEEGPIPKTTLIISLMLMVAAGLTAWWWMTGGDETVRSWF